MRKLLLLLFLCAMSNLGRTQAGYILYVNSAPSGTCSQGSYERVVIGPGTVYTCQSGTWAQISGGGGGITSIATTAPITGGTITTTGTLACGKCVFSTSPGVGLAHFAGSTQEVTSSAVNLAGADVTGTLPAANLPTGVAAPGMILLEEHTASTSATLDFTSCISSTYDEYAIEFLSLIPATNAVSALFRVSTNGGSTYDAGSNYAWVGFRVSRTGSAATGADADTKVDLTVSDTVINTSTAGGISGSMRFFQPGNGATSPRFTALIGYNNGGSPVQQISGTITGVYTPVTAVNAFRFLFSSGNIASGTVRCYGVTK